MTTIVNYFSHSRTEFAQTTSTIIVTKEGCVICNDNQKTLDAVSPCLYEDTRIFLHARDAVIEGSKDIDIKANDTDIIVIAVCALPQLHEFGVATAFRHGGGMKWIPIHELLNAIGPARASVLCISMPSLDVMWYVPSEERGRNRHGRHGMYLMRPLVWTKRGCTCLPASSDPMTPFHQPMQLYGNMLSEVPIKQASYGARIPVPIQI